MAGFRSGNANDSRDKGNAYGYKSHWLKAGHETQLFIDNLQLPVLEE